MIVYTRMGRFDKRLCPMRNAQCGMCCVQCAMWDAQGNTGHLQRMCGRRDNKRNGELAHCDGCVKVVIISETENSQETRKETLVEECPCHEKHALVRGKENR